MISQIDISDILSSVHVPTLVIHCTGDTLISVEHGRFLAAHIPGARLLELPGDDHLFFIHDQIVDAIEEFLTGSISEAEGDRVLATVLFTDIVGSTARAEQLGDQRWRNLLEAHHTTVRRELARFRGDEVRSLGDGFLRTRSTARPGPCVVPARLQRRSVLSTFESAVASIPARSRSPATTCKASRFILPRASQRSPGLAKCWYLETVKDLVAGSGLRFSERGRHSLKGVQEPMDLYAASN